uniref:Putative ovule protein n=1 Tax=Solanum chacoense TaxID=4108 RepID=A0A0V0HBZ2_SOLCH
MRVLLEEIKNKVPNSRNMHKQHHHIQLSLPNYHELSPAKGKETFRVPIPIVSWETDGEKDSNSKQAKFMPLILMFKNHIRISGIATTNFDKPQIFPSLKKI